MVELVAHLYTSTRRTLSIIARLIAETYVRDERWVHVILDDYDVVDRKWQFFLRFLC